MRKLILLLLLNFAFCSLTSGQNENQQYNLFGKVNDDTGSTLSEVNIINLSRLTGTTTNDVGLFGIHVKERDTVQISAIGFKTVLFIAPTPTGSDLYKTFTVFKDTVNLSEVIIYPYPSTLESLKKDFLTLELPNDEPIMDLHLEDIPIEPEPQTGAIIQGPFTMLYETISRHGKILKKYGDIVGNDQLKTMAAKTYTKELVKKITGLQKAEDISKFMEFCNLEPEFILNSKRYELYLAISNCFKEFTNKKE